MGVVIAEIALLMHVQAIYWIYAPGIQRGLWSIHTTNRLYGSGEYFANFDWGPGITAILKEQSEASIGLQLHLQQLVLCAEEGNNSVSLRGPAGFLLPGLPNNERSSPPVELHLTCAAVEATV